jgi:hypothetical protein
VNAVQSNKNSNDASRAANFNVALRSRSDAARLASLEN